MSYNKRTWATGNVVGAVDLNRMEQGIEDAGSGQILVVNAVYDSENEVTTLDKTWQEIYNAFPMVYVYTNKNSLNGKIIIGSVVNEDGNYVIDAGFNFSTDSPNGYPSRGNSGAPVR